MFKTFGFESRINGALILLFAQHAQSRFNAVIDGG